MLRPSEEFKIRVDGEEKTFCLERRDRTTLEEVIEYPRADRDDAVYVLTELAKDKTTNLQLSDTTFAANADFGYAGHVSIVLSTIYDGHGVRIRITVTHTASEGRPSIQVLKLVYKIKSNFELILGGS